MSESVPFHSGFIALVGRPNSGKSTLMNTIIGEQLSIVTSLPQTTRRNLRGIYTDDHIQIVFVDTPGIHQGKHAFNEAMIREAKNALVESEVDLVCYLIDLTRDFGTEESIVARIVDESKRPVLLIFNKTDLCDTVDEKIAQFTSQFPRFRETPAIRIAAQKPQTRTVFLEAAARYIPEGPRYFEGDDLTDENLRFFAAEYIRKQIILNTREEVPHATFVEVEMYRETPQKHFIEATIHVETVGQRGIIVGKNGTVIAKIRKGAERELAGLTGVAAQINCHVKISPKWRDNDRFLRMMGMQPPRH